MRRVERDMEERKYKVLIADDEYWTREKLKRMIPWGEYSLELLPPAADGEEVLRRMEEEVPDILITDIDMPFLSGTELLKAVQERHPEVISFVVSGYNDFAYVKDSFMAGSINYLMKPVTKMDLVNALVKALQMIGEREHEQKRLQEAASLIQDTEFSEMIAHRQFPLASSVSANTNMDLAGISLILLKIHNLQEIARKSGLGRNGFSFQMKEKIRAHLQNEKAIVFNYIYHSNEFLIITEMGGKELETAAGRLMTGMSEYLQTNLTLCISGHSYSMESIHMAYMEAIGLLMERKFCRKDEIMTAKGSGESTEKMTLHFREEMEKQVNFYLTGGDGEGVCRVILEETGLENCEKRGWSYLEVKQTVRQIMNVLQDFAVREGSREQAVEIENMTESLDKTVESLDIRSVCDMIREVVSMLAPEKKEPATDSMKAIVREAAAWIDGHVYEELTLTALAEQFHVEHSYFSRVFRQEIGESPVLYITRKRMEKAKQYIEEGKKNLTEVAFMVGYDDYTYFSRVFRKNAGMSPREYRSRLAE